MLRPLCLALTAHNSFRFIMGALIILLERPSPQMPIYPPDWLAWNLQSQIWRWIHFVHVLKVLFPAKPRKAQRALLLSTFPTGSHNTLSGEWKKESLMVAFALQFFLLETNLLQICWWWNKQTCCLNCQRWNHPTCSFPRFSLRCESSETGSAPAWTLLSLTSAVISHGYWLSNNDCLSARLSAAQNTSRQSWSERTYLLCAAQNAALTSRYRGLWEYEFPVIEGDRGGAGRTWQRATQIWDLRLTSKTIATRGVGPEARRPRSKPESILHFAFLYTPFAPLLLCLSVLAGQEREGHLPRGSIIHCPWSQRKQRQTQRQRSLPFSTVPRRPESHISI